MDQRVKFVLVVLITVLVFFLGTEIVPAFPFLKNISTSIKWISSSLWVQLTLLVSSLILITSMGQGKFSLYGFKLTGINNIIKPVFISLIFALILFFLNIIHIRLTGPPQGSGRGVLSGNLLQDIIYVWIIASSVEELFFRGFVQTSLQDFQKSGIRFGKVFLSLPVIVAALLFSLMHFCLWDIMPHRIVYFILINTFFLGLIAGYWREKTGSLIPAYGVHLIFNVAGMMLPRILMSIMG